MQHEGRACAACVIWSALPERVRPPERRRLEPLYTETDMHSCRTKTTNALPRLEGRFAAPMSMAITLLLACSSAALLSGCGDDGEGKPKDAGPTGEPCVSPGITEGPCECGTTLPGYRVCEDNRLW